MKKIKKKIQKKNPVIQDDNYQLKSFAIIVVVLLVLSVIFYIITNFVITKENKEKSGDQETSVNIQSEKILMGQLLNRPEETYYVLANLRDDQFIKLYDTYLDQLKNKEEGINIYKVDLDEGLNKKYVKDETNITDDLNELSVNDAVLFVISNHAIDSYYVGNEQIVEYLKGKINE